jgi:predicted transcriptional regulator/ActR/RegA family two-component response regulator
MDERDMVRRVKVFASSELKLNILLCLKYREMDVNDLQAVLGGRNTTILHAIRDMTDDDLISRGRQGYRLTNLGKIRVCVLESLMAVLDDIEARPDFWLNHDISSIPPEMLERLSMLRRSEMVSTNPASPLEIHERLESLLSTSKKISAILPLLIFPKDSKVFTNALRSGSRVDLLMTEKISGSLLDDGSLSAYEVERLLNFESFRLRLIGEDLRLALFVTESFLYLGLYRHDGVYDVGTGAIYLGESAVAWGMELFEYYAQRSRELDEGDLKRVFRSVVHPEAEAQALAGEEPGAFDVMIVEDDPGHATLIRRIFEESSPRWRVHHASQLRDALRWIEDSYGRPFLVVADYLLPDGCGLDLAGKAERPLEVGFPLIILTGFGSEKIAVQAFKSGVMDYVVKEADSIQRLPEIAEEALLRWRELKRRAVGGEGHPSPQEGQGLPLKV